MKSHFKSYINYIILLISSGRNNTLILSILITEAFFRRRIDRLIEILMWIVLYSFKSKRVEYISAGIAQVQLKHWLQLSYIDTLKPSLTNIKIVLNIYNNYDICCEYLNSHIDKAHGTQFEKICITYTGAYNSFYIKLLKTFYNKLIDYRDTIPRC